MSNTLRVSVLGFVSVIGCMSSPEPDVLTYEEFKAQAYQEPDTGIYIINGDEPVETEEGMRSLYDSFLESVGDAELRADGYASTKQGLIVNTVNGGQWDRWTPSQALNITYCISSSSFGSRYNAVVAAMTSAAGAWEGTAAKVNFVHASGEDSKCTKNSNTVVFNVRQVCTGQYLARAFFPSTSRRGRELLIDCTSFGNTTPWTLAGILRHELGHTLGFRHEHTRPDSGTCFENNAWASLTSYDSASVMHYPQCNGTNTTGDLDLTGKDTTGAYLAYP